MSRLILPLILLAAFIGTTIALNRVQEPELVPVAVSEGTAVSPETPVFSVRRAPQLLAGPRANSALQEQLDQWVVGLPDNSCLSVTSGPEILYEHNVLNSLSPASNMKILTGLGALIEFGADHTFETSAYSLVKPDEDGVLTGDLFLVGGGDPLLSTRAYLDVLPEKELVAGDNNRQIATIADELAENVVAQNLSTMTGGVKVDDSRYDSLGVVPTWPQRFLDQGQVGVLSAAVIDDGYLGWGAQYSQLTEPEPLALQRSQDAAAQSANIFDDLLEAETVIIQGSPGRAEEMPPVSQMFELASIESPPMSDIVKQMLNASDNTTAELLLKELGLERRGFGDTTSGNLALSEILAEAGLPESGVFPFDGSGLSIENTVTCDVLTQALNLPQHKDLLYDAMPIAGETGTLYDNFLTSPAKGKIHAKTGFLNTVSSLSGYIDTDQGVRLTFAFVVNVSIGEVLSEEVIAGWQEPLAEILLAYPEGPPLSELGPVPVAGSDEAEEEEPG